MDVRWGICWSTNGNPYSITLNVEEEQSLDVYKIANPQPGFNQFQVPTEKGWEYSTQDRIIPTGNFANPASLQLEVRVTAKNAKRIERTYSLQMVGNAIEIQE